MDDLHQGVIDLTRTALAGAMLDFYIRGKETDAGGEETDSGSSKDKQLASRICSYQMCKM